MKEPKANKTNGHQQKETPTWKREEDSPIEQAKVHPFIKKCIQSCAFSMLVVAVWTCMYHFNQWEFKMDSMFDMFYLMLLFGPPILILCFMHIVRTGKVGDER